MMTIIYVEAEWLWHEALDGLPRSLDPPLSIETKSGLVILLSGAVENVY